MIVSNRKIPPKPLKWALRCRCAFCFVHIQINARRSVVLATSVRKKVSSYEWRSLHVQHTTMYNRNYQFENIVVFLGVLINNGIQWTRFTLMNYYLLLNRGTKFFFVWNARMTKIILFYFDRGICICDKQKMRRKRAKNNEKNQILFKVHI